METKALANPNPQPSMQANTAAPGNNKERFMTTIKSLYSSFISQRNALALVILFSAAIAVVVSLLYWGLSPNYKPLYASQEGYNTADIITALEQQGANYQMDHNLGLILVPSGQVAELRMLLAAKGIKAQLPDGFSTLNEQSALGTSQFMEKAQFTRGLEGELAKSIMSLNTVRNARVHLSVPKESLFVGKNSQVPTASVLVELKSGTSLTPTQTQSIINLVMGSVAGMKSDKVTVTDQFGRLLSDELQDNNYTIASSRQLDYKANIEKGIKLQVANLLSPMLGHDNFRVEASANIDFAKEKQTIESFDTTPQVIKEHIINNNSTTATAIGIPGSLSNNPPLTGDDNVADDNANRDSKSEVNRNFVIGSSIKEIEKQQGILQSLTLSVVVNDAVAPVGSNDATPIWNEAELNKIETIIASAVGINDARGDVISVNSFTFNPVSLPNPLVSQWYQQERNIELIKYAILFIAVIVVVFVVLRPLVKSVTAPKMSDKALLEKQAQEESIEETTNNEVNIEHEIQARLKAMGLKDNDIDMLEHMLPDPDSPIEVQLKHLQLLTKQHPERVSEIIRTWINA